MADQIAIPQLRDDSLYYNGFIFLYPDGSISLERDPLVYQQSEGDRYYTTIDGETLWNIAYQAYGNSKYWWIIAEANGIDFPFDLPAGSSLIIPDIDQVQQDNL
jgi:hypothetical protein